MPLLKRAHRGKKLEIEVDGKIYQRFPIKTPIIHTDDDFLSIIEVELAEEVKNGDILLVAESIIAISEGRAFKFNEIKYGRIAKFLSKRVRKSPHGIGLGTPQTMQLAIKEVGLARILFAAFVHAITSIFGWRGNFYRIAGEKARGIDGPTEGTISPFNTYVTLAPKDPALFAKKVEELFLPKKVKVVVIDANDLGVNILGEKDRHWVALAKELASDNPLGQSDESTPILLCRPKEKEL